jgi:hypothetical protein
MDNLDISQKFMILRTMVACFLYIAGIDQVEYIVRLSLRKNTSGLVFDLWRLADAKASG